MEPRKRRFWRPRAVVVAVAVLAGAVATAAALKECR
jgi:hypothetical protein